MFEVVSKICYLLEANKNVVGKKHISNDSLCKIFKLDFTYEHCRRRCHWITVGYKIEK